MPTAAWVCALIALLNAFAWSLIVPPFQGKDEADHYAYVAELVESGTLPEHGAIYKLNNSYSPGELSVLLALHYPEVVHSPQTPTITTAAEQQKVMSAATEGASLKGIGEAGVATSEPPLYYAIEAVPFVVGRGNVLVQLQLMRLLGAFFGAITALLTGHAYATSAQRGCPPP